MKEIMHYQIEVGVCMTTLSLLYLLLWRKDTNFTFKRFLFLGITVFSLVVPLINLNINLAQDEKNTAVEYFTYIPSQLDYIYTQTPLPVEPKTLDLWGVTFRVFCSGVFIMFIRLLVSYYKIWQIYLKSELSASKDYRLINNPIQSFSFFNLVMINRSQAQSNERDYIIAHEKAHSRQRHSFDVLWFEAVKMLHWINPFIWLIARESRQNMEYLADQEVVACNAQSIENYQFAIVHHASNTGYQLLKSQFSKSNLKNRILMMNQPNNRKVRAGKLIVFLPVLAILFMSFSLKIENLDIKKELVEALPSLSFSNENVLETTVNLLNNKTGLTNSNGVESNEKSSIPEVSSDEILENSEVPPQPSGKPMKYFYDKIFKDLKNHAAFKGKNVQGTIYAQFIVMKDGSLRDIKVIQGINPECDDAVIKYIQEAPPWTPGTEVGQPVNVRQVLPFRFGDKKELGSGPKTLIGKLINEQDFTAVVGAKVAIKGTNIETITDDEGIFKLNLDPTQTEIIISSRKFKDWTLNILPSTEFLRLLIRYDEDNGGRTRELRGDIKSTSESSENKLDNFVPTDSTDYANNEVFTIVEQQPTPSTGDMDSYYEVINANLRYPEEAKAEGVKGKVFVQFIVTKEGSLSDVKVIKGIDPECDEEAVRVVKEGPGWIPGKQNGKVVNVRFVVPIHFGVDRVNKDTSVKGKVVNNEGTPIPGCNVIINGTTTGTVTDENGYFRLELTPSTKAQEITVAATGYLTESRYVHNGSIHQFALKKAEAVSIRGLKVFNPDDKPLFIIDGVEIEDFDEKALDPNDIESIEVLKDSSKAKEEYGEKAKNGVIKIKLKKSPSGSIRYNQPDKSTGRKIKGRVLNENGDPIEKAMVNVKGSEGYYTDENGNYELTLYTTLFPNIQAYADGYVFTEQNIANARYQEIVLKAIPYEKIRRVIEENGPTTSPDRNFSDSQFTFRNYDIVLEDDKVYTREPEIGGNFEKFGQELGIQFLPDSAAVRLFGENARGGVTMVVMR